MAVRCQEGLQKDCQASKHGCKHCRNENIQQINNLNKDFEDKNAFYTVVGPEGDTQHPLAAVD